MSNANWCDSTEHLRSVDFPAIEITEEYSRVHWAYKNGELISSDAKRGLVREKIENREKGVNVKLLILKKSPSAASNTFGWKWFIPLIIKYKWALILVFAATMVLAIDEFEFRYFFNKLLTSLKSRKYKHIKCFGWNDDHTCIMFRIIDSFQAIYIRRYNG